MIKRMTIQSLHQFKREKKKIVMITAYSGRIAEIIDNYVLHPSNCIAYELLEKKTPSLPVGHERTPFTELDSAEASRKLFASRINELDEPIKTILLKAYANPVYAKLKVLDASS